MTVRTWFRQLRCAQWETDMGFFGALHRIYPSGEDATEVAQYHAFVRDVTGVYPRDRFLDLVRASYPGMPQPRRVPEPRIVLTDLVGVCDELIWDRALDTSEGWYSMLDDGRDD